MSIEVTEELRMAVRREECSLHGHRFDYMVTISCLAPQAIYCHNCGSMWRIHPEDVDKNWGTS